MQYPITHDEMLEFLEEAKATYFKEQDEKHGGMSCGDPTLTIIHAIHESLHRLWDLET